MELLESPSNKDVSLIGNFIKERQIFYPNTLATARILCSMSQEKTCVLLLSVELFFERLQLIRLSSESVADGNNDDDNNNDDNGKNNNNDDNDDNNADNNNNDNNDDEFRSTGFPRFLQH